MHAVAVYWAVNRCVGVLGVRHFFRLIRLFRAFCTFQLVSNVPVLCFHCKLIRLNIFLCLQRGLVCMAIESQLQRRAGRTITRAVRGAGPQSNRKTK